MMKLKAYRLHNQAVALQSAAEAQTQDPATSVGARSSRPDASSASLPAWELLCPTAFEATWNGGPRPEDVEIRLEGTNVDRPPFVQSQLGKGRLTFYSGYQFKAEGDLLLWVRGPVNAPKDGIAALEQIVDATLLPCTVAVHWQFTAPGQTVHFAAGEPFATILPYPAPFAAGLETVSLQVVQREVDEAAYEQAFQQMVDSHALRDIFARLGADPPSGDAADPQLSPQTWAAQLTDERHPRDLPPVSCICPTYGRVELLEEAIYSFLQQDYPGKKELIVLNDYAGQTLEFDHPEVHVVNLPSRLHSVGEKYKAAANLASHDLIFVWHDDDIYLPHRLSYSVAHCGPETSFFKADKAWFWNDGQVSGPEQNVFHGGSCWRRDLFRQVHGYPHVGRGYDVEFEQLCREHAPNANRIETIRPADIYTIYRWSGTGSYHLSMMDERHSGGAGRENQDVAAYVERQAAQGQIPQGQIRLLPRWKKDYGALVRDHLATLPVTEEAPKEDEIPFPPPFHVIPPPPLLPAEQAVGLFRGDYPARISVVLPAANESVLLQRTVDQFVATLPENSEVIVVDNGSTDGSSDFLANGRYESSPNGVDVYLIRTPDPLGVAGARNRGLAQAQGEIVVFCDAHMDLPERWWQPIVHTLQRPEVGVVGPGIGVMGRPDLPAACGQRIAEAKLRVEWLPRNGAEPHPVPTLGGGFMAMRHDTLKQAGAFDDGMPQWGSEDLELCVRYWLLGYEVWVQPDVTVLHYFRKVNPYKVGWGAVTHNLLRVALLHFGQVRIARVLSALKDQDKFVEAIAYAVESDVWQKRAELAVRRAHDDDWLFEKFAGTCQV